MSVPVSQMFTVASYVIKQKLRGRKRYPLVLMLEPLFRCNLACAGCGKIQYPAQILKKHLTRGAVPQGRRGVRRPDGEHPGRRAADVSRDRPARRGLVKRKKYIYLCTNAILLKEKLDLFTPSKYLTFSVHMDGLARTTTESVCRDGVYDQAVEGIGRRSSAGSASPRTRRSSTGRRPCVRQFFDEMMALGVEGMMVSPGYSYAKAPDQEHFLAGPRTHQLFPTCSPSRRRSWKFNQSPLFLGF